MLSSARGFLTFLQLMESEMSEVPKPSIRRVTCAKLKRDVENLRKYARFVIVLNETFVEVVDNIERRNKKLPFAKLIAIIGPAEHEGIFFNESLLMEVGYSNTRPYKQTELWVKREDGSFIKSLTLKQRPRVRKISDDELSLTYPHIVQCMTTIVLEQRAGWMIKEPWFVSGARYVERGIFFTISRTDALMHRQMVLEDVRYRKWKYIYHHASWIRARLGALKSSYYTSKQLKSFARIRNVAQMLSNGHYTAFYRAVLCRQFAEGTHVRCLLDSIMEVFHIDVSLSDEESNTLDAVLVLPKFVNIRCYRPPVQPRMQPRAHGQGSSIFEVVLERKYREKNEVPF